MRILLSLSLLLLCGCWEQFSGLPPVDDDDDASSADDDDGTLDDDDATSDDDDTADDDTADDDDLGDDDSADDDDSGDDDSGDDDSADDDDSGDDDSADDDDSTPDPCTLPQNISRAVTLLDPNGNPSSTFTPTQPLTVHVEIENLGGTSQPFFYPSACLFSWSLWKPNGDPVDGGPSCLAVVTTRIFDCGAPPQTGEDSVLPIESLSGLPLDPGDYTLNVDTIYFGTQSFTVTVP